MAKKQPAERLLDSRGRGVERLERQELHAGSRPPSVELYFVTGTQSLWRSDGTPAGTLPVADLCPDDTPECYYLRHFTDVDGTLVFERMRFEPHFNELWMSDGTAAGTRRLTDACQDVTAVTPGAR